MAARRGQRWGFEGARLASEGSSCGWGGPQELKRAQCPTTLLPTFHRCGWLHGACPPPPPAPILGLPIKPQSQGALATAGQCRRPTQLRAESPGTQLGSELGGKSGNLDLGPCSALCGLGQVTFPLWAVSKMVDHFPGGSVSGAFMVSDPSRALWYRLESTDSGAHRGVHVLTPIHL